MSADKVASKIAIKYPTTMSCTECFDQLTECFSIGGQFRNYYRYGKFDLCEKQGDKLKFCLANSTDPVKVQEWYKKELEYNKKYRGTSDDVWEER
ncbi:related to Early meiotic induction protein 1 [Saccharomycodes ludwigii]|uniref:Related to Early meiotic induction protein 1 n=1 Tax=Saccharomycodes ludwigii TaxID=36035 RepID=A0A376B6L4_9ASCO|nr:hypothetical protein SCDLUD_003849 [Saccharomycodes ludwigii]KAH3899569.1 hypothetical protein SCDLUD_003849 [Saccharomycodes ludwigii]SSD60325.1 related to Early meiotic induction protein 1 [Saccharomycodes ludwigii]